MRPIRCSGGRSGVRSSGFRLKFELLTKEEAKRIKLRTIDDFGDPENFGISRCQFQHIRASNLAQSFALPQIAISWVIWNENSRYNMSAIRGTAIWSQPSHPDTPHRMGLVTDATVPRGVRPVLQRKSRSPFLCRSGATVVVVAGDQQGKLKVDDQVVAAVVDAAIDRGAARIVLVTPLGGGGEACSAASSAAEGPRAPERHRAAQGSCG